MTSIRARLLTPLLPLTALALFVTAAGIHESTRRDLLASFDRGVLASARALAAGVEVEVDGTPAFDPEDLIVPELSVPDPGFFYVVLGGGGQVVAQSPRAPGVTLPAAGRGRLGARVLTGPAGFRTAFLPVLREPERDPEDVEKWREAHPGEVLPEPVPRTLWVVVGRATKPVEEALSRLRRRLAVGFGGLFVALVLLPAWIVSRTLRPLAALSRRADEIGPDDPSARLPEAEVAEEIRGLVRALNRALERLAAAYERQKRFSADAAHELRSPLAAVQTECEVALRRPRPAQELRAALERVVCRVRKLAAMVEELLRLSRLENGVGPLDREEVDLAFVAAEAAALHRPAAEAKDVALEVRQAGPVQVRGDPGLLEEAVSNLVENAVRYTPSGGRVEVTVRRDPSPVVEVTDTGPGIPPEHLTCIFERFQRVEPGRSRRDGGSGLGLAIAQEIARLHGAEIRVESEMGRGSIFRLEFPAN
ncbi:MAG: HAMP domain-containing protein [Deltaproteobacteria bacterium]|nr:HAMP domain-containing protein [Deltaproteobacteria bacterium]